jgi:hypothetical protein
MDSIPHAFAVSPADALARRYGAEAAPAHGPWNEHIALLLSHRSIRGYRPDAPPPGMLETLVAAAQSAATSSNLQAWSVVAVTDAERRRNWRAARSISVNARCSWSGSPTCHATGGWPGRRASRWRWCPIRKPSWSLRAMRWGSS